MPLPKQKFREAVLQILYSLDFEQVDEIVSFMMAELKTTRKAMVEAKEKAEKILSLKEEIDPIITSLSTEYRLERISSVEKAILRLGLYELLFEKELPREIVLAESIRICRKFGTPESSQFINAILDKADGLEAGRGAEAL